MKRTPGSFTITMAFPGNHNSIGIYHPFTKRLCEILTSINLRQLKRTIYYNNHNQGNILV